jgi:hypothetical protein
MSASPLPFQSRRRHPRVEVLGEIEGRRVPLDISITMRDLSQGGFSAESSTPFPPGTSHHFRFTAPAHGSEVSVEATAVHCRLASASPDGGVTYVTGFEFHSDAATDKAVATLIASLVAAGTTEP